MLEMDPGTSWPRRDVHEPGPEEVYVVAGIFSDGARDYPAGTFPHAPVVVVARARDHHRLHAVSLLSLGLRLLVSFAGRRGVHPVRSAGVRRPR
ncbi:hypothetical protein [Rugosimonospora africana]|uniref:Uncharacterized protein n=1 Tax=Rugosimonospora africana TaxID=556532 RepID=A0A8J3QQM1_9ACTN|nr:hypothetical protein Raf01_32910 [Rugosimonospora africana]